MKKIYLIVFLNFLHFAIKASNETLVLDEAAKKKGYINAKLKVATQNTDYNINDILKKNTLDFKYLPNNRFFNFGFSAKTYWLKVDIQKRTSEDFVFLIEDASLAEVEFFIVDAQHQLCYQSKSGTLIKPEEKKISNTQIAFLMPIKAGEVYTLYIKARTNGFFTFPAKIELAQQYQKKLQNTHITLGLFYGFAMLLLGFSLIAFITTKKPFLFGFILNIFFSVLAVASYDGVLAYYLPTIYRFTNSPEAFLISLALASSTFLSIYLLNIPKHYLLHKLFVVLSGIYVSNALLTYFNHTWGVYTLIVLLPAYLLVFLGGFFWAYQNKMKIAKYFTIANIALVGLSFLNLITMFDIWANTWWASYGLHTAYMAYISMLSAGIVAKLEDIRKEISYKESQILKEKAKKDLERERNIELAEMIESRTQQLSHQNEELTKLNAELDRFVYSISHELSSPLKSLIGLIQLMKVDNNPNNLNMYLEMQEKSIQRLDSYTKELTGLLRNARIDIQKQSIFFRDLLNDVLKQRKADLGYDKVKKIISIKQEYTFVSDASRLTIMLGNLISNSVQYRREGILSHVKIQIEVLPEKALITISDNGQGIEKQHLENVFVMFYRANEKSQGSGLGLYIVKEIIHKLNGKISMHSEYGVGTIFKLEIPNLA